MEQDYQTSTVSSCPVPKIPFLVKKSVIQVMKMMVINGRESTVNRALGGSI